MESTSTSLRFRPRASVTAGMQESRLAEVLMKRASAASRTRASRRSNRGRLEDSETLARDDADPSACRCCGRQVGAASRASRVSVAQRALDLHHLGMERVLPAALLSIVCAIAGCSSVGGSAIRTGPLQLPAYAGPVAIYAMGQPPAGAVDLGVVEVHAAQQEATVDTLLPQFVRKVAQIGGNVAVIEGTRARFELAARTHVETFYYTCGMGATCAGTRVYSTNDEIMIVSMFGRAMTTQVPGTSEPPLIPPEPPPSAPPVPMPEPEPMGAPANRDLGAVR